MANKLSLNVGKMKYSLFHWKERLKYTENTTVESIGSMYKVKPFLDKDSLLSLYFSYIFHT